MNFHRLFLFHPQARKYSFLSYTKLRGEILISQTCFESSKNANSPFIKNRVLVLLVKTAVIAINFGEHFFPYFGNNVRKR